MQRPYPYFMGGSVKVYPLHQLLPPTSPPRIGEWNPTMRADTRASVASSGDGAPIERQLYIHVPFCPAFCHFCILYKAMDPKQQGGDYRELFVAALLKEIEAYATLPTTTERPCGAVYFGGGTPSQLSAGQVRRIMDAIREHIPLAKGAEVTFEGMPHQLKVPDYLKGLMDAGVNRISFGIQTFQPDLRRQLGRIDTVQDIQECSENVAKAGIKELNVELLFGIPGITPELMRDDLEQAISLNVNTLDLIYYNATPGTQYYDLIRTGARPPQVAGDDLLDLRRRSVAFLEERGFLHTSGEVFDRNAQRLDRFHEIHFGGSTGMDEILALGPSSYGFLNGVVYQNVPSVARYMECLNGGTFPLRSRGDISPEVARRRGLLYGLQLFRVKGKLVGTLRQKMLFRRWERLGLLRPVPNGYELTHEGRNWYNLMQLDLVPPTEGRSALDLVIDAGEQDRLLFRPEEKVGNVGLVREIERFIQGTNPLLKPLRRYFFKQYTRVHRSRGKLHSPASHQTLELERGQNAFTGH